MADVFGLAASAITLAALFSQCIDCFSFFKDAQNCSTDAKTLLVKLDCEKARLLVWANTVARVGILGTDDEGRYPQLADRALDQLIRRCILQIISLLTDAQKLQVEYGGRQTAQEERQRSIAAMSVNSMSIFRTTKLRFFARAGGLNEPPNWLSRIKFCGRHHPAGAGTCDIINNTVEEDITTIMDISSLRLAEDACEESYPSWSARASEVRRESEFGTVDRRNLEEMMRDADELEATEQDSSSSVGQSYASILEYHTIPRNLVAFTDSCLDLEPNNHCDSATIGRAIYGTKDLSFTSANRAWWNLGRLLMCHVPEHTWGKIYIHCGPCACAIQTALKVTTQYSYGNLGLAPVYHDFAICIDERLPTSCRRGSSAIDTLVAIRDFTDGPGCSQSKPYSYIDCPELEKRIYDAKLERSGSFEPKEVLQRILVENYELYTNSKLVPAIIFIAETTHCLLSAESRPFIGESRKPRETDYYTIQTEPVDSKWVWQRKYLGSYNRSHNAIEKLRDRSSLFTDLSIPQ